MVRGTDATAADLQVVDWLVREGVADKESVHLHLDAGHAAGFLDAIAGHGAVTFGKERVSVSVITGQRLRLATACLIQDEVRLVRDAECAGWTEIGGAYWQVGEDCLRRAGEGVIPASLVRIVGPLVRGEAVLVPLRVLLENLDSWQDWLAFPVYGWLENLHFVAAPAMFSLALDGSLQHLSATLTVAYANSPAVPPGLGSVPHLPCLVGGRCEIRDESAESRAVSRMQEAGFLTNERSVADWSLDGESSILHFLSRILPSLRNEWRVSESERFKQVSQGVAVVSPKIQIIGRGEDWLQFDLTFQSAWGSLVPANEVRQWLRMGNSGGKLSRGRRMVVSDDLDDLIEPLFSELDLRQSGGHFEASARAGEVILAIQNHLDQRPEAADHPSSYFFDQPSSMVAELRPYQMHGAGWLIDRVQRFGGALLADDMGLGKTLQAIALIESLFARPRSDSGGVLVIATTSLLGNWRAEFARFAPARRVRMLHGVGRDAVRDQLGAEDVILTSYGTLARDLAWHLQRDYLAVVVDEASLMRNPDTDHAKAIAKLRASNRIALTGTPVENGVRDLWSIFRFIQPGWLGSRAEFRARYEQTLVDGEPDAAMMARLKLKIHPFLLRRTKEQVAPELPSKIFIDEFCDLSPDQQAVYRDLLVEGRKLVDASEDSGQGGAARMRMLTALLRLRQTCCDLALLGDPRLNQLLLARRSAKLQRLLELLDEALAGNHRVLVFSQFQKQLLEIEKCVIDRGWGCLRLDGQTRKRQELVDRFQDPTGPPVFLISLKAGGYGLNLIGADTVVHFDPWWNPAAEMQATDRAHRIGQTRPVTVYRLLTRGTVEEKVVRLQAKKRELSSSLDESGGGDVPGWSIDDFKALMGGD